jgi:hypothetical protein
VSVRLVPLVWLSACWVTGDELAFKVGEAGDTRDTVDTEDTVDTLDPPDTPTPPPVETGLVGPSCPDEDLVETTGIGLSSGRTEGTGDDVDARCGDDPGAPDLTFAWRAPSAGCWVFDTNGSGFDTLLELRDACDGRTLGCNDNDPTSLVGSAHSRTVLELDVGDDVVVVLDGATPTELGRYQLNIGATTALVADADLGSAVGPDLYAGDNGAADTTLEPRVEDECPFSSANDVLLRWVAPEAGAFRVTVSPTFDAMLALYDSCDDIALQCVDDAISGDEAVSFDAYAGQAFVFRVASYQPFGFPAETGTFDVAIDRQ